MTIKSMWRHFIFIPLTAIAEPFMDSLLIDQENTTGGMSLWQMVTPGPLTWTIKTVSSRFMTAMIPIPTESLIFQMRRLSPSPLSLAPPLPPELWADPSATKPRLPATPLLITSAALYLVA